MPLSPRIISCAFWPLSVVRHPLFAARDALYAAGNRLHRHFRYYSFAMLLFIIGTEIRVRIEDSLLASHFGNEFREYRRRVSAYVPFLR